MPNGEHVCMPRMAAGERGCPRGAAGLPGPCLRGQQPLQELPCKNKTPPGGCFCPRGFGMPAGDGAAPRALCRWQGLGRSFQRDVVVPTLWDALWLWGGIFCFTG